MPLSEPIELKLRIKKSRKQGEGKLLDYMKNHPTLGTAEVVLEACRAYWMPLAFFHEGESNAAVLRSVGWKAIGELEAQIKLIKRVLQLELAGSDPELSATSAVPTSFRSAPNRNLRQTPEELDEELGANDF